MVASIKTVWVSATCLLLLLLSLMVFGETPLGPSMDSKRFFEKLLEYVASEGMSLKDYDDFVPLDNQANDIAFLFPSSRQAAIRTSAKLNHRPPKMSHRSAAVLPTACPPREKKRLHPHSDAIRLDDISFPIATRKEYGNWNRSVHAECTFLVGLSDFNQRALSRPQEYLLSWNKLKTTCRLSSFINGMRDGEVEAGVLVGPLRMVVRVPETEEFGPPETHMTEAMDARVTIRDVEGFPTDFLKEVSAELEKTILCIVNLDVRTILTDSLKCLRVGSSSSCKLTDG